MAFLANKLSKCLRSALILNSRCYSKKEPAYYHPLDVTCGAERAELVALLSGDDDPYKMKPIKRRPSSKSDPIPVPSYHVSRIVGCVCEEESNHVKWFWLHQGEPRRCDCGHWFKLELCE